jgi:uncharacterized membrane protein YhiD involved in acid resistance
MNKIQDIQKFFAGSTAADTSILLFLVNLFLAAVLSYWIGKFYVKYGTTLSNRQAFAKNFVLITLTTMLVISIVKSSLALSLGLIGALSIVRFRAAIKEPQELSYLFLAIAVGLGMGANQHFVTIVAVVFIIMILRVRAYLEQDDKGINSWDPDLYLTVSTSATESLSLKVIAKIVDDICSRSILKRADSASDSLEVLFLIEIINGDDPHSIEAALRAIDKDVKITLLEPK